MPCQILQRESNVYLGLEESDICLLQAINCHIDTLYEDYIVLELRKIIISSIVNKNIQIDDLNRLLELLPQFKTYLRQGNQEDSDELSLDWPEFEKCSNVKYKRECIRLHQRLNNLVFMQYAVHQKNVDLYSNKNNKSVTGNGIKNSIEKL